MQHLIHLDKILLDVLGYKGQINFQDFFFLSKLIYEREKYGQNKLGAIQILSQISSK